MQTKGFILEIKLNTVSLRYYLDVTNIFGSKSVEQRNNTYQYGKT